MRLPLSCLVLAGLLSASFASFAQASKARLTPADETAAFRAAGFKKVGGKWKVCEDGSDSASYSPGSVDMVRDINGDGRPDAVLIEGGAMCYGMTGQSFWLVSKQADGSWRKITESIGIPSFLPGKTPTGWPDIEIGGPGFCFPVWRWNGRAYALSRFQYEGKPCRPPR